MDTPYRAVRRWGGLLLCLAWFAAGCSDDQSQGPLPDTMAGDAGNSEAGRLDSQPDAAPTIGSLTYDALKKWATPIEDYIKAGDTKHGAGNFYRDVHDLCVYKDRLYLGYGDANVNMGRTFPIEFRYFASPSSAQVTTEFKSHDEQLENYRLIGQDLFMAGIDSSEDAWLGNVYYKWGDAQWVKGRTLQGGVHVHDVARFGNNLYAVGSGATQAEWGQGKIYAHLWESIDKGKTFTIKARKYNEGLGDRRYVRLLPLKKTLYLFGYWYQSSSSLKPSNARFDGSTREDLAATHPLRYIWAHHTEPINEDLGILLGMKIVVVKTLKYSVWKVSGGDKVSTVDFFDQQRVIDLYKVPHTGEVLVLSHDESDYTKVGQLKSWKVHLYLTRDFSSFVELLSFTTTDRPRAIAYWQDSIYYGNARGEVWRAEGEITPSGLRDQSSLSMAMSHSSSM